MKDMIPEFAKRMIIEIALRMLNHLPQSPRIKKIHRSFYIQKFLRTDIPVANVEIARDAGVKVGKNCRFYDVKFGIEPFLIEIGDNVLISGNVQFINHDGGINIFRFEQEHIVGHYGKIKIGNNCFIGFGSIILPNVQIGNNCIICAGSVVASSFPDDCVIMGNPAKVIFKTSVYKKMKLASPYTVYDEEIWFPESDMLPQSVRKEKILKAIDKLPIRKPR